MLRRSTVTVSPTRTQKVFPLSACVMEGAPAWQPDGARARAGVAAGAPERWPGWPETDAVTVAQPTVTAATRQAASPAEMRCI